MSVCAHHRQLHIFPSSLDVLQSSIMFFLNAEVLKPFYLSPVLNNVIIITPHTG